MIIFREVTLFVGGKILIGEASFQVVPGDRIAVVGRNGSGKSHLMQLLAGSLEPDAGTVTLAANTSVLLVNQALPDETLTPIDFLRQNDPELCALQAAVDNADSSELGDALEQLTELDDERYQARAPKVLAGLGLSNAEMEAPMGQLSGGKRMRVGLAMVLIRMPTVLLLDEPTNHLDLESTQWLIEFLKNYPKESAIVVTTHDARLIREVSTSTLHLRCGEVTHFKGTYDQYRTMLSTQEARDRDKNAELQKQIERHNEIYMRFRKLPAKRAAQAVAQKKRADQKKTEIIDIPTEEPVVPIRFASPSCLQQPTVRLINAALGYTGQAVLNIRDLSVSGNAKIGLLGRNGQGKTTLVRSLIGQLPLLNGIRECDPRLSIGYFSQDLMEQFSPELTVAQQFMAMTNVSEETAVRSALAEYGFPQDKIRTLMKDLSGGETARLLFLIIKTRSPSLIVLDEPTNHLDMETREALISAIQNYRGALVLISHDADLLEQTMNEFWLVDQGRVSSFQGGLKAYRAELQKFVSGLAPASALAQNSTFKPKESANSDRHVPQHGRRGGGPR